MKILVAGDFYVADAFKGKTLIDESVARLFATADYRIVNLEAPLTLAVRERQAIKTGPHLASEPGTTLPYLKQLDISLACLANNHIMDYGEKGLFDTFEVLRKARIEFVGAGANSKEAAAPFSITGEGITVAVLNFAENEWSIADESRAGANALDVIENVRQIKAAKATHDKVVCIIHGGHELYRFPSPRMVKQYRFYVENGADAIVGHHTHCIGTYEVHKNAPIIYSLGNFLFTLPSKDSAWYMGILVQLDLQPTMPIGFSLFPVRQDEETFKTSLLQSEQRAEILQSIEESNIVLFDTRKLQQNWEDFAQSREAEYLACVSPINCISNKVLRNVLFRLGCGNLFLNEHYLKGLLNRLRCEAHSDLLNLSLRNCLESKVTAHHKRA